MTTYANLEILMDGAIRLYQDADLKGDVWQCRLRVPGVSKPYIRSTKTSSFEQAKDFATKLFYRLCYEVEHGIPIGEKTFRDFHRDFMKDKDHLLSVHRKKLHKGTADRYFIPFFGDMAIKSIDEGVLQSYWEWRITYWASGPGAGLKIPNAAKVPAQKSMDMERSMLTQILKHAKIKKFISGMPLIDRPTVGGAKNAAAVSRRPAFTPQEMEKLIAFLEDWPKQGLTKRHRQQRQAIQANLLFFYYSGLRPNELFQIRWCDVRKVEGESEELKQGYSEGGWIIHVPEGTKTGFRHAFALPQLGDVLEMAAESQGLGSTPFDSEALIFPNEDGTQKNWWQKTFTNAFELAGVLRDSRGRKHTAYSLRHTFITERLLHGVDIYQLSRACGTSVQYIRKHYDHTDTEMHIGELTKTKKKPTREQPLPPGPFIDGSFQGSLDLSD